jgi:hypothetical protein
MESEFGKNSSTEGARRLIGFKIDGPCKKVSLHPAYLLTLWPEIISGV